jgi:hypothetical protein
MFLRAKPSGVDSHDCSCDVCVVGTFQSPPEFALRVSGGVQPPQFGGQIKVEASGVMDCRGHRSALYGIAATPGTLIFTATGKILEVRAPFLLGITDVIAVPSLTLFFGTRFLHFGACAAAKACHEDGKKADNFAAGEHVFHIFSRSPKMAQRRN